MPRFASDREINVQQWIRTVPWYGLAALLVAAYVNTFSVWRWLATNAGNATASVSPFLITAIGLATAFFFARRRGAWPAPAFLLGVAIALGALFLTDPDFPAKRIHVPQYMLLSLVLRRALYHSAAPEPTLTSLSVAIAALCGIHDEFLQGFHPDRGFGLRDIGVNAMGALSGGLLAKGLCLFTQDTASSRRTGAPPRSAIAAVIAATLLLIAPMEAFRGQTIPLWTVMPLLAACGVSALLSLGQPLAPHWRAGGVFAFSLIFYPLVSHALLFR